MKINDVKIVIYTSVSKVTEHLIHGHTTNKVSNCHIVCSDPVISLIPSSVPVNLLPKL